GIDEGSAYKASLADLIRRARLDASVKIVGRVSDDELFGWYRAADAYVSLSEHEGFGVPLVEAMAFDLPVVAYSSAAIADTLGGAGILIADKEPATILEALRRLDADPSYRRDVIRAQRARLQRFGRNRIESELRRW